MMSRFQLSTVDVDGEVESEFRNNRQFFQRTGASLSLALSVALSVVLSVVLSAVLSVVLMLTYTHVDIYSC